MKIIDAKQEHYEEILKLNEELVHFLSPMDMEKFKKMSEETILNKVVIEEGEVAAFLMAFSQGKQYDSVNYKWFDKKYEKFLYVDRIVISPKQHRKGIGKELYNYVFDYAKENNFTVITCEIDIKPINEVSLAFHESMGFKEVGRQEIKGGEKVVSLQARVVE